MADLTKREKLAKGTLYEIGYEYLRNNFHKFNERNKIKVAISILSIFEKDDSKTQPINQSLINLVKLANTNGRITDYAGAGAQDN